MNLCKYILFLITYLFFVAPALCNPSCANLFVADNLEYKYHSEQIIEEDSGKSTRRFNIYMTNFALPTQSPATLLSSSKGVVTELEIKNWNEPEAFLYIANKNINKNYGRSPSVLENEFEYGLNFIEKSHGVILKIKPDQNIKVSFFIQRARKKYGAIYSQADKADWIETRSVEIQQNNEGYIELPWENQNMPDWLVNSWLEPGKSLFTIGLRIKKMSQEHTNSKIILDSPIFVDYSFSKMPSARLIYDLFQRLHMGLHHRDYYSQISEKFISKILTNLYLPQNILYARETLRRGVGEVHEQIRALNLDIYFLEKKMNAVEFFELIEKGFVPIEQGQFKEYHGEYSHALQILAMTRGLSPSEREEFQIFYQMLGFVDPGWKIWNLLFDSESPQEPINPQFWRN